MLNKVMNKARLQNGLFLKPLVVTFELIPTPVFPTLLQDIFGKVEKWGVDGQSGRIDPFTEIRDVSIFIRQHPRCVPS